MQRSIHWEVAQYIGGSVCSASGGGARGACQFTAARRAPSQARDEADDADVAGQELVEAVVICDRITGRSKGFGFVSPLSLSLSHTHTHTLSLPSAS